MNLARILIVAMVSAALAGCAAVAPKEDGREPAAGAQQEGEPEAEAAPGQGGEREPAAGTRRDGEQELAAGVQNYEDGKYNEAQKNLQTSLDLGLSLSDQVKAHKYLAFIHCVSESPAKCRAHFRMALTIDPSFELDPAEAGHPIWGPAFRSVKGNP